MEALKEEVRKNLLFLIDMDMFIHGKVSNGTLEAIKTQGYYLNNERKLISH